MNLNKITEYNKGVLLQLLSPADAEFKKGKFGLQTNAYGFDSEYDFSYIFDQLDSTKELSEGNWRWLLYYQGEDYSKQYLVTMDISREFLDQLQRGLSGRNITKEQALNLFYQYAETVGKVRKLNN